MKLLLLLSSLYITVVVHGETSCNPGEYSDLALKSGMCNNWVANVNDCKNIVSRSCKNTKNCLGSWFSDKPYGQGIRFPRGCISSTTGNYFFNDDTLSTASCGAITADPLTLVPGLMVYI